MSQEPQAKWQEEGTAHLDRQWHNGNSGGGVRARRYIPAPRCSNGHVNNTYNIQSAYEGKRLLGDVLTTSENQADCPSVSKRLDHLV